MTTLLGEVLRAGRQCHGLSQRQVAQSIGVSQAAVAMWERGRRLPAAAHLGRLHDLLDLDASVLLALAVAADDA
jgi:transcriptional regulator with XRE-family HTH domain